MAECPKKVIKYFKLVKCPLIDYSDIVVYLKFCLNLTMKKSCSNNGVSLLN